MKKTITPAEYKQLSEDDSFYYYPEYVGYRVKKEREYETCDLGHKHYIGWFEHSYPIGKPIAYKWHTPSMASYLQRYYSKKFTEQADLIFTDIKPKDVSGKTILFTRHTPLK